LRRLHIVEVGAVVVSGSDCICGHFMHRSGSGCWISRVIARVLQQLALDAPTVFANIGFACVFFLVIWDVGVMLVIVVFAVVGVPVCWVTSNYDPGVAVLVFVGVVSDWRVSLAGRRKFHPWMVLRFDSSKRPVAPWSPRLGDGWLRHLSCVSVPLSRLAL